MKTISGLLTVRAGGCFVLTTFEVEAQRTVFPAGSVPAPNAPHELLPRRGFRVSEGRCSNLAQPQKRAASENVVAYGAPRALRDTTAAGVKSRRDEKLMPGGSLSFLAFSEGEEGGVFSPVSGANQEQHIVKLSYILAKRTNGANPFKVFEALAYVNDPKLADLIRRMEYSEFLETAYWFAISHTAKSRAGMRCQVCNSGTKISAHHRTYENHGAEHLHMNDITVLCENCHGLFHGHMEPAPVRQPKKVAALKVQPAQPSSSGRVIPHTEEMIGMPDGEWFTLTIGLINACRANGSFTNATLRAFGLTNPLVSGWASRLVGRVLTRARYRDALEGRFIYATHLRTRTPDESEFDEVAFLPVTNSKAA